MLFFERMKTQRGEWPKTFAKDQFPQTARTQCWQLLSPYVRDYKPIVQKLRHATGVYTLNAAGVPGHYSTRPHNFAAELQTFLHDGLSGGNTPRDVDYALTVIELLADSGSSNNQREIAATNHRLRLAGVGYKIIDGALVPVDDEELTNNAVVPAISILNREEFGTAYGYLRQAFSDYKEGETESLQNAIDNTVKAVEAVLKVIFEQLGIPYGPKDTYMPLLQKASENGLFPSISGDKISPITNELKALGEIRNKEGGHGGADKAVSDKAVRLAIHHATANLLYIVETYLERKQ